MDNAEVARVVKYWLTLASDITENEHEKYVDLSLEPDIETAKQGMETDIGTVRDDFANLLFSGQSDWLYKDNDELEDTLPEWFVPGSNDEYYLEQYATSSPTDVRPVLNFLSVRLAMWARGEGRPKPNPDYVEGEWPTGTQYYKYDGERGQWLYSPVLTGEDWETMEDRESEAAEEPREPVAAVPPPVDISTAADAQKAAADVAVKAEELLNKVLEKNPESAKGVDSERMKQLVLEALRTQQ
jgi:hypothetical protein